MPSGLVLEMKQFVWQGLTLYIALAGLQLVIEIRLAWNSEVSLSVSKVLGIKTCKNYAQGRRF